MQHGPIATGFLVLFPLVFGSLIQSCVSFVVGNYFVYRTVCVGINNSHLFCVLNGVQEFLSIVVFSLIILLWQERL